MFPSSTALGPLQRTVIALKRRVPDSLKARIPRPIWDFNGDYARSVFLAGVGRSGTTWVANIINYDKRYRDIFEPFHSHFVPVARRFIYSLYLRPDNKDPIYLGPAQRIVRGRVRNRWVDQDNRRAIVHERLIKEIRANLWLKWLKVNFPKLPIVLLMRHPWAVASSQMVLEWPTRLQQFLAQAELARDHLEPFYDAMHAANTPVERRIFVWCIQHYVPLRQFGPNEIHIAFYENFLRSPEDEIRRLFAFIGRTFDDAVLDTLEGPSRTTRKGRESFAGATAPSEAWQQYVDGAMLSRAVKILTLFGLDRLYGDGTWPRVILRLTRLAGRGSLVRETR